MVLLQSSTTNLHYNVLNIHCLNINYVEKGLERSKDSLLQTVLWGRGHKWLRMMEFVFLIDMPHQFLLKNTIA